MLTCMLCAHDFQLYSFLLLITKVAISLWEWTRFWPIMPIHLIYTDLSSKLNHHSECVL